MTCPWLPKENEIRTHGSSNLASGDLYVIRSSRMFFILQITLEYSATWFVLSFWTSGMGNEEDLEKGWRFHSEGNTRLYWKHFFSQGDARRLEVAPTLQSTQKTSLYCLHDYRGYGEGRSGREGGNRGCPHNFTEGGKRGWRETEICAVVKVLLNVFTFTCEEEMKAHMNEPIQTILASYSQTLGQRRQHWSIGR